MTIQLSVLQKPRFHPSEYVAQLGFNSLKGSKVMFIHHPLRETATPNTPPQGPGLMSARVRQYGGDPTIVDLNIHRIKDAKAKRRKLPNGRHLSLEEAHEYIKLYVGKYGEPEVIALSGMITTLDWQEKVAKMCRELVPDAFIVSGGGLATDIKLPLLDWIPELDAIAHSEGDDVILILANEVNKARRNAGSRWRKSMVGGPYYKGERSNGRPVFMYAGQTVHNLDDLPFAAWDLLKEDVRGDNLIERYILAPVWGIAANNSSATPFTMKRSLTFVGTRGCPDDCSFCDRGAQGDRIYRRRSLGNVRAEIEWLVKEFNVDFVGINDDNNMPNKKEVAKMPEAFAGLNVRWGTHARLDECDERLKYMAAALGVYVGAGAESASISVLERMHKGGHISGPAGEKRFVKIHGFDIPQIYVDANHNCRKYGIHLNCTWIMAYPGERLVDLQTSVVFIRHQLEEATSGLTPGTPEYDNAVNSINQQMFTATAYPGTPLFNEPVVQEKLHEHFGINFKKNGPVMNGAFINYVRQLDDATKVLRGRDGTPINYGAMPDDQFLEARGYADSGQLFRILDM